MLKMIMIKDSSVLQTVFLMFKKTPHDKCYIEKRHREIH